MKKEGDIVGYFQNGFFHSGTPFLIGGRIEQVRPFLSR